MLTDIQLTNSQKQNGIHALGTLEPLGQASKFYSSSLLDRWWTTYAFFLRHNLLCCTLLRIANVLCLFPRCNLLCCMLTTCLYAAGLRRWPTSLAYITGLCHWPVSTLLACLPHYHPNCPHYIIVIFVAHPLCKWNFYFSLLCDWIFPISTNYFPFFFPILDRKYSMWFLLSVLLSDSYFCLAMMFMFSTADSVYFASLFFSCAQFRLLLKFQGQIFVWHISSRLGREGVLLPPIGILSWDIGKVQ